MCSSNGIMNKIHNFNQYTLVQTHILFEWKRAINSTATNKCVRARANSLPLLYQLAIVREKENENEMQESERL